MTPYASPRLVPYLGLAALGLIAALALRRPELVVIAAPFALVVAAGLGVVLLVVSSAMGQIYKTAVYLYAETGEIAGYSSELLEGAFRDKRPRRRFFG